MALYNESNFVSFDFSSIPRQFPLSQLDFKVEITEFGKAI